MEEMMEQQEPQAPQESKSPKEDKKLKKEMNVYEGGISKILHGKQSKAKVYEMLKSAPPEKSIPETTMHINMQMIDILSKRGKKPSLEAIFGGTVFTIHELAEIGEAGGFFEQPLNEENIKPVLQASLQKMIEEGVRAKVIDPIELQEKIEPLLSDEQKQMGLQAGQQTGVPAEPNESVAMERYAQERVMADREQTAKRAAAKGGQMQQAAQGGA
jgi:hypothetical protein